MAHSTLYALRLEQDKYYVGITRVSVEDCYRTHANGAGAAWTRRHPPVAIHRATERTSRFDELELTLELMARHGIDNVRGGPFCTTVLDVATRTVINSMLNSIEERCFKCNKQGHRRGECPGANSAPDKEAVPPPLPFSAIGTILSLPAHEIANLMRSVGIQPLPPPTPPPRAVAKEEEESDRPFKRRRLDPSPISGCPRCGRHGHSRAGCVAKRHIDGRVLHDH